MIEFKQRIQLLPDSVPIDDLCVILKTDDKDEYKQKTLIKLSSLIIQDLVKSQIKSKKQSLMDSQT